MDELDETNLDQPGATVTDLGRIKSKILEYLLKKRMKAPVDTQEKSEDDDTDWGN